MGKVITVMFAAFCGGLVQSVTGFGAAVVIMIFLPAILSMTEAPAVSNVITMTLSVAMFWRYRKSVRFRSVVIPSCAYLLVSMFAIHNLARLDLAKLKGAFGLFLIALSIYFFVFCGAFTVKPTLAAKLVCGALSGACGGLFAIGGPPASLFYLASTDTKEEYLGTLNAFFTITVIGNIAARIYNGFLPLSLFPLIAAGIAGILAGCAVGGKIVGLIKIQLMRRFVYAVMAFSGVLTVIQSVCR